MTRKMRMISNYKAIQGKNIYVLPKKKKRKTGAKFYRSEEWLRLRYRAFKKHGKKCQCCGRSWEDGAVMHVDHIKPKSRYPELAFDIDNLQVLCDWCNKGKGAWDQTDHRG